TPSETPPTNSVKTTRCHNAGNGDEATKNSPKGCCHTNRSLFHNASIGIDATSNWAAAPHGQKADSRSDSFLHAIGASASQANESPRHLRNYPVWHLPK